MGAFIAGMQLGRDIYNDAETNRLRKLQSDELEFNLGRQRKAGDREDRGYADLDSIANGNVPGQSPLSPPISIADPSNVGTALGQGSPIAGTDAGAVLTTPAAPDGVPGAGPAAPGAGLSLPGAGTPAAPGTPPAPPSLADHHAAIADVYRQPMDDAGRAEAIANVKLRMGDTNSYFAAKDKAEQLRKYQSYRAFGQKLMNMSDADLVKEANDKFLPTKAGLKLGYDAKTNQFSIVHPDGSAQNFNGAEARSLLLSAYEMGNGDVQQGVQAQLAAYQSQTQRAAQQTGQENTITEAIGKQNLATSAEGRRLVHEQRMEEMAAARLKIAERAEASHNAALNRPTYVKDMIDKDGNPVAIFAKPDGTFTSTPLPTGLRNMKDPSLSAPPSRKDVAEMAKGMINNGEINPETKKPYTTAEAVDAATELLTSRFENLTGGGEKPTPGALDVKALRDALEKQKKDRTAGTSVGGGVPQMPPALLDVGGLKQVNPAYAAWQQQYGAPQQGPRRVPTDGGMTIRDMGQLKY